MVDCSRCGGDGFIAVGFFKKRNVSCTCAAGLFRDQRIQADTERTRRAAEQRLAGQAPRDTSVSARLSRGIRVLEERRRDKPKD